MLFIVNDRTGLRFSAAGQRHRCSPCQDGRTSRRVKPVAGRVSYRAHQCARAPALPVPVHDGAPLAADDAITDIDKQAGAMAEVHEIDRIGGLVGIKLDTNIPSLPCSVGMVGHDTRPRHTAFDGLLRAVGHLIVRHEDNVAVDAHVYDVHAAVPCLSAAACSCRSSHSCT